jgi:hypothetical protein
MAEKVACVAWHLNEEASAAAAAKTVHQGEQAQQAAAEAEAAAAAAPAYAEAALEQRRSVDWLTGVIGTPSTFGARVQPYDQEAEEQQVRSAVERNAAGLARLADFLRKRASVATEGGGRVLV